MEANLLGQGITLMLVGMGTVCVFLTTLVVATTLMSRLITRLNPALAGPEELAAISAAISHHRRQR